MFFIKLNTANRLCHVRRRGSGLNEIAVTQTILCHSRSTGTPVRTVFGAEYLGLAGPDNGTLLGNNWLHCNRTSGGTITSGRQNNIHTSIRRNKMNVLTTGYFGANDG